MWETARTFFLLFLFAVTHLHEEGEHSAFLLLHNPFVRRRRRRAIGRDMQKRRRRKVVVVDVVFGLGRRRFCGIPAPLSLSHFPTLFWTHPSGGDVYADDNLDGVANSGSTCRRPHTRTQIHLAMSGGI